MSEDTKITVVDDDAEAWEKYRENPLHHTVINMVAENRGLEPKDVIQGEGFKVEIKEDYFFGFQYPQYDTFSLNIGGKMRIHTTDMSKFEAEKEKQLGKKQGPHVQLQVFTKELIIPMPSALAKPINYLRNRATEDTT